MKKHKLYFLAFPFCALIFLASGCNSSKVSTNDSSENGGIASSIKDLFKSNESVILESFQEVMDKNPDYSEFNIVAKQVSLVKRIGNQYDGLVEIEYNGKPKLISITATIDGGKILWETKAGQFAFLALEELEKLEKGLEKFEEELEEDLAKLEDDFGQLFESSNEELSSTLSSCRVFDPNDTYVNVRKSPNGELIEPLLNNKSVSLVEIKTDSLGRQWALVEYDGRAGFVMNSLIACQ